jgi:hypothetical protein
MLNSANHLHPAAPRCAGEQSSRTAKKLIEKPRRAENSHANTSLGNVPYGVPLENCYAAALRKPCRSGTDRIRFYPITGFRSSMLELAKGFEPPTL